MMPTNQARMPSIFGVMWVALCMSGCGRDDVCDSTSDCFMGQVCSASGACIDASDVTINSPNNNATSGGSNNATTPSSMNNATTPSDNNAQTGGGDTTPAGVCRVDPFNAPACGQSEEEASDEPNDESSSFDATTFASSRGGCFAKSDSNYSALDASLTRKICHWEARDWYRQNIGSCTTRSFVATFELTPKQMCLPEEVRFRVVLKQQGDDAEVFDSQRAQETCAQDLVNCEQLEHGGWRVQVRYPSEDSADPAWAADYVYLMVGGTESAQFEYDLRVMVPEL